MLSLTRPGLECSVVVYSTSHTPSTSARLEEENEIYSVDSVAAPCELFYVRNIVAAEMFEGEARVGRPLILRLNNILIVFLLGLVIVIKRIRNIKFFLALTLQLFPTTIQFSVSRSFSASSRVVARLGFWAVYAEQLETSNNTQQQQQP